MGMGEERRALDVARLVEGHQAPVAFVFFRHFQHHQMQFARTDIAA